MVYYLNLKDSLVIYLLVCYALIDAQRFDIGIFRGVWICIEAH